MTNEGVRLAKIIGVIKIDTSKRLQEGFDYSRRFSRNMKENTSESESTINLDDEKVYSESEEIHDPFMDSLEALEGI